VKQLRRCWPILRRELSVSAAGAWVERSAGGLDRTMAALEPYLLQLRLEKRGRQCVSRASGHRHFRRLYRCYYCARALYGAVRRGDCSARVSMPASPCFASATIMSRRRQDADGAGPYQDAARPRRDAGRAQSRLWWTAARAGQGRSDSHAASDIGDESLMMARNGPGGVARDRISGVALARSQGASVILMDDGFQNPAIAKDAVADRDRTATAASATALCFPAGPFAPPLAAATSPH